MSSPTATQPATEPTESAQTPAATPKPQWLFIEEAPMGAAVFATEVVRFAFCIERDGGSSVAFTLDFTRVGGIWSMVDPVLTWARLALATSTALATVCQWQAELAKRGVHLVPTDVELALDAVRGVRNERGLIERAQVAA